MAVTIGVKTPRSERRGQGGGGGIALSLVGVLCTVGAGFFGWTLIQTDHLGVELSPDQTRQRAVGRRGVT